ncbi:MAG: YHS domain protein [Acidobacteria bacterium]|nr:YHS domain protein [Acidobacteriota bacterium]
MKHLFLNLSAAALLLAAFSSTAAAEQPRLNTLGHSVAVGAFDPVSYFPEGGGTPKRGLIGNAFEYQGATYRFSNKENLAKFRQNPAKYAPAYNGWCAWALAALDKEVDVDPTSFVIRNGKLYLFYKDPELDTRAMWQKDAEGLFKKAETNWNKR